MSLIQINKKPNENEQQIGTEMHVVACVTHVRQVRARFIASGWLWYLRLPWFRLLEIAGLYFKWSHGRLSQSLVHNYPHV